MNIGVDVVRLIARTAERLSRAPAVTRERLRDIYEGDSPRALATELKRWERAKKHRKAANRARLVTKRARR